MDEKVKLLAHWCVTDFQPAIYDVDSATAIEQTAKVYAKMQELVTAYNTFVDNVNKHILEFEDGTNKSIEVFQVGIRQEFQDFIDVINLKIKDQDKVIADAVIYMKEHLVQTIKDLNESGELNEMIVSALTNVEERLLTEQSNYESSLTTRQTNYENNLTESNNEFKSSVENTVNSLASDNATFKSDLTTQQNTFEANITERQNTTESKEATFEEVVNARMNQFGALTEGSTTGDAELLDIRVGYDGTTYDSAGDSVRGQATSLSTKIDETAAELKSDLAFMKSLVPLLGSFVRGYYFSTTGVKTEFAYSNYYKVDVSSFNTVFVNSPIQTNISNIVFVTEDDTLISSHVNTLSEGNWYKVPDNAKYAYLTTHYNNKELPVYVEETDFNVFANELKLNMIDDPINLSIGDSIYNYENISGTSISGFKGYYYDVSENDYGKTLHAVTRIINDSSWFAVTFLNSNGEFCGGINKYSVEQSYNKNFRIPYGISRIVLCTKSVPSLSYLKYDLANENINLQMKAKYNSNTKNLSFKYKFEDYYDFCIDMGLASNGNGLFDFLKFYKTSNQSELNDDFTVNSLLSENPTDFFGPYIVQAVNNADGDLPEGYAYHFTGGRHRYNNGTSDSTPTARTESVICLFDGKLPENDVITDCNEITVKWKNYIQAKNTKKEDGTGREVLTEEWTIHITKNGIEASNIIIPLEDIIINRYYGLQCHLTSGNKFIFIGVSNRNIQSSGSNAGNLICNKAIESNSNMSIGIELDKSLDLGQLMYNTDAYSIFSSGDKTYTYLIKSDQTFNEGDRLCLRGKYTFGLPL